MPVRICSHNTAMTQQLARLIKSMRSVSGSCNPMMVAKMLAELKALHFDNARIAYYGYQAYNAGKQRRGNGQLSFEQSFARGSSCDAPTAPHQQQCEGPVLLTVQLYGLASSGHGLIRRWFMNLAESNQNFQILWRQQNVTATVLEADHTLKTYRGSNVQSVKVGNNRSLPAPLTELVLTADFQAWRCSLELPPMACAIAVAIAVVPNAIGLLRLSGDKDCRLRMQSCALPDASAGLCASACLLYCSRVTGALPVSCLDCATTSAALARGRCSADVCGATAACEHDSQALMRSAAHMYASLMSRQQCTITQHHLSKLHHLKAFADCRKSLQEEAI
ncbi:hypothetical protein JKP88DRAFT_244618 [Tribonema minus]|uniref:Uncharacterized protein n=1 Tax=Tribonema minus TaxID=303371 RepID=A0A835Z982_9STRA|nr:hypothetical protein JKP88DRAFT_244618 [Tribonema minus]